MNLLLLFVTFVDIEKLGNKVALELLSLFSLLGLTSKSESDLLSIFLFKKALFAAASDTSDSWLLLVLTVSLSSSLTVAKAAKKTEDKLLSNTPMGKLGLITCLAIKSPP